jgi:hypothetical protein
MASEQNLNSLVSEFLEINAAQELGRIESFYDDPGNPETRKIIHRMLSDYLLLKVSEMLAFKFNRAILPGELLEAEKIVSFVLGESFGSEVK